jgi:predicted O-methyltransferase YrrM
VKSFSDGALASLLAEGKRGYFDFIYVDGSHRAPDVLYDAVLSFRLLRVGGVIAFDDYLWDDETRKEVDPIGTPKIAIDAFTNIYSRKLRILRAPLYQLYIQKIAD